MKHLDSEAFGRWLIGERGRASEDHIRDCAKCRAEASHLKSAITDFRDAARQWSDRQPFSRPPAGWAPGSASGRRWRAPAPMRWAAMAAATALLAALPLYHNYSQRRAAAQARANALLMEEVSVDISRPAPEPLEPLIKLVSKSTTGDNR